jgi:hypothetical protein
MASTAIARARAQVSGLTRKLTEERGTSYMGAAMTTATVGAGAFGAGYADASIGEIAGQRPSLVLGLAGAFGGVVMKSPMTVKAAAGALAINGYQAGFEAAGGSVSFQAAPSGS